MNNSSMTYKARLTMDVYVEVENYDDEKTRQLANSKRTDANTIHKEHAISLVSGVAEALNKGHRPRNVSFSMVKKPSISGRPLMPTKDKARDIAGSIARATYLKLIADKLVGYHRLTAERW
jgi:hypothetical protein